MKRKFLVVTLLLLTSLISFGFDIASTLYYSIDTAKNITAATKTNVSIPFPISGRSMVESGFIDADTLNSVYLDSTAAEAPSMPPSDNIDMQEALEDDGGIFTDYTTAMNEGTAADVPLLPAVPVVGDAFYYGMDYRGRILYLQVGIAASGVYTLAWEYYNGVAWTALTNVNDSTDEYRLLGAGTVSFDMPTDWTAVAVNALTSYYIRSRVTAFTSLTTQPFATQGWWQTGIWWAFVPSILPNETKTLTLYTGGPSLVDHHQLFVGATGIVTTDTSTMEPTSTNFVLHANAFIDTSAGANKYIVQKTGALTLQVTAATQLTLSWTQAGPTTNTCVITGVPTGYYNITISRVSTSTSLSLTGDSGNASCSNTSLTIDNTANNWNWGINGSVIYFDEIKMSFSDVTAFDTQAQFDTGTKTNVNSYLTTFSDAFKSYDFYKYVEAATDDGEWTTAGAFTSSASRIGNIGGTGYSGFFRFTNVTIDYQETISAAKITLTSGNNLATTTVNFRVYGVLSGNASTIASAADANSRVRTTAFTDVNNVGAWTVNLTTDTGTILDIDITAIIQEIVNLSGWASGNSILIFIQNNASSVGAHREPSSAISYGLDASRLTINLDSSTYTADYIRKPFYAEGVTGEPSIHPIGWTRDTDGTVKITQVAVILSDVSSLHIQPPNTVTTDTYVEQTIVTTPGQVWSATGWFSSLNNVSYDWRVSLIWLNSSSGVISTDSSSDVNSTTSWTLVSVANKTAPALTAYVKVRYTVECDALSCTSNGPTHLDSTVSCVCAAPVSWGSDLNLNVNAGFETLYNTTQGTWVSPAVSLSAVTTLDFAIASWQASVPEGASTSSSGVPYSALHVTANKILNEDNQEVRLRGVNQSQFQYTGSATTDVNAIPVIKSWNANTTVIHFSSNPVNARNMSYINGLDLIMSTALANEMYIILMWRNYGINDSDARDIADGGQPDMPSQEATDALVYLANRYKDNFAVIYGLQNEPHDTSWATLLPIFNTMVAQIHAVHPEAMISVPGTNYSRCISQVVAQPVTGTNIFYNTHPYDSFTEISTDSCYQLPTVAASVPVVAGEFGLNNGGYQSQIPYYEASGIGWLAWVFNANDLSGLNLVSSNVTFVPTNPWGNYIRNQLIAAPAIPPPGVIVVSTEGTSLTAETSIDNQTTWQPIENGGAIPGLVPGTNVSALNIRFRFTFNNVSNLIQPSIVATLYVEVADASDNVVRYAANELVGLTISDRSETGNPGTMSFPTIPSGLVIAVGPLLSRTAAVPDIDSTLGGPEVVTNYPTQNSKLYSEGTGSTLPFYDMLSTAATNSGIPIIVLWFTLWAGVVLMVTLITYATTGNGLVAGIACGVAMAVISGTGTLPFWIVIIYAIMFGGYVIASKSGGP